MDSLKDKLDYYIKINTAEGKDWKRLADEVWSYVESGFIKLSNISYNDDGTIKKITGTTFKDGVFQFVERKKPIPVTIQGNDEPNPQIEELRKGQAGRRRMVIV